MNQYTYLWRSISSKNCDDGPAEEVRELGVIVGMLAPLYEGGSREDLVIGDPGIGADRSRFFPVCLTGLLEQLENEEVRLPGLLESFLTYCAVSNTLLLVLL